MCLYEFVGSVEKIAKRRNTHEEYNDEDTVASSRAQARGLFSSNLHTQYKTHALRQRVDFAVPVILGDRIPRSDRTDEEKEKWARVMLILFVPWRQPSDLHNNGELWYDAYIRQQSYISDQHKDIIGHMNVLSECRDVRDAHSAARR
ncbi:hypothetical protein C8Q76DRAFT_610293, partial [Earliella scabrosa]